MYFRVCALFRLTVGAGVRVKRGKKDGKNRTHFANDDSDSGQGRRSSSTHCSGSRTCNFCYVTLPEKHRLWVVSISPKGPLTQGLGNKGGERRNGDCKSGLHHIVLLLCGAWEHLLQEKTAHELLDSGAKATQEL